MRRMGSDGWKIRSGAVFLLAGLLASQGCGVGEGRAQAGALERPVPSTDPVRAPHGMVVSQSAIASEVGARVLEAGGNAVDAAIATGFALAVTHPTAGNIGGGGFMVIRFPDGRATTLDFREKAPMAARPEMFLDEDGEYAFDRHHNSHVSVGVPGTVAGFWQAHQQYGSETWSALVDPAVELAAEGFPVSEGLAEGLEWLLGQARDRGYQGTIDAYSNQGRPYQEGETLRLPDLSRTLGRIRDEGRDGFYQGETARLLAEEMARGGGLITEADLASYQAVERAPVRGSYRGYELISMPPPSSGGVALVEMLNILEGYDLGALGHNSPAYLHLLAESMRRAFLDRARYLGDPDFNEMPLDHLMDKGYATELRAGIDQAMATPSDSVQVEMAYESPETTHYSVVDQGGMAVSVTYTLEFGYGSRITVPGAGFLLNNEMGDFNGKPGVTNSMGLIGTPANLARPGQRMLSSMSPSIVAKDGRLVAVIGTPGGRTIINTVLQVFLNVVDFGMNIQEAVNAPRIHHQWLPDRLRIEEGGLDETGLAALRAMGHDVSMGGEQGSANSIMIDPGSGDRLGAPDPRSADAGAAGH
ncbi:MAG: gamma-glutamyltransferase [Gemmatimonadota bacterium]